MFDMFFNVWIWRPWWKCLNSDCIATSGTGPLAFIGSILHNIIVLQSLKIIWGQQTELWRYCKHWKTLQIFAQMKKRGVLEWTAKSSCCGWFETVGQPQEYIMQNANWKNSCNGDGFNSQGIYLYIHIKINTYLSHICVAVKKMFLLWGIYLLKF